MAGVPDHLAAVSIRVRHALRLQGHLEGRSGVLHSQRECGSGLTVLGGILHQSATRMVDVYPTLVLS